MGISELFIIFGCDLPCCNVICPGTAGTGAAPHRVFQLHVGRRLGLCSSGVFIYSVLCNNPPTVIPGTTIAPICLGVGQMSGYKAIIRPCLREVKLQRVEPSIQVALLPGLVDLIG